MKCKSLLLGLLPCLVLGCQPASSVAPPASSKKIDVQVDAPGVKVDIKGQKKDP